MNKLCNIYKSLLTGIFFLVSAAMFAQAETFNRAQQLYREKNTELAAQTIDSVIVHPETMNDPLSWISRAFIYYELYKSHDKISSNLYKLESRMRDTAIASLKRSNALKPDADYVEQNLKLLNTFAGHYYNIAGSLLQDSINYSRSEFSYNKYKEYKRMSDPTFNFKQIDIEYYLAVGSVYSEIFTKDSKNVKAEEIAKTALMKVLDLDPNNPSANINLGLMYYNQAANISKEMSYDIDISQIDIIQENMIKLAKQAEPFVLKVYTNDHNNERAMTALYYIYRMLNDIPKSDEYKQRLKQKGVNVDDESKPAEENAPKEGTINDKNQK